MSTTGKQETKTKKYAMVEYDDRKIVLSKLNYAIDYIHHKATNGRITKPENEKVRIQWFRVLAYTCSIYNQIKRDMELEKLQEEIKKLSEEISRINREAGR